MSSYDNIIWGGSGWGDASMFGEYDMADSYADHHNKEDDCSGLEEYRQRMKGRVSVNNQSATDDMTGMGDDDDDDDSSCSSSKGGGKTESEFHRAKEAFLDDMIYGEDDPRPSDVGIFLTKSQLHKWRWETAPKRYPQIYGKDFKMYGDDDDGPHGFGTKIKYRWPTSESCNDFTILGSKMFDEFAFELPHYIICSRGEVHDLSKINISEAHEEYRVGWDDGEDELDESVYDLLPKPPQPTTRLDPEFEVAEERYKRIMEKQVTWKPDVDGSFEDLFIARMFPKNLVTMTELRNDYTLEYRALILDILLGFTRENKQAVILENERDSKWLVLEHISYVNVGDDSLVPGLGIHFGISYEQDRAIDFVQAPTINDISFIKCSGRTMSAIQNHILNTCCGCGLNDGISGLLLFEGCIVPMDPPAPSVIQLYELQNSTQPSYQRIPERRFGLEFELSCTLRTPLGHIGYHLYRFARVHTRNIHDRALRDPMYLLGLQDDDKYSDEWRIDGDGSIQRSPEYPNSSNFELISPILKGEAGVYECKSVLSVINDVTALFLNESMAFHIHIEVVRPSLDNLKSISINFLLYEDAIDLFMAKSRRTGANKYCRSNLNSLMKANKLDSKQEAIERVQNCRHLEELYDLVNPKSRRYYKMNLQNLKMEKRPTIEFRQHSATSDPRLVEPWIRFCMALVYNSIRFGPLNDKGLDGSAAGELEFDDLFDRLIQDPELKRFYRLRREELRTAGYVAEVSVAPTS